MDGKEKQSHGAEHTERYTWTEILMQSQAQGEKQAHTTLHSTSHRYMHREETSWFSTLLISVYMSDKCSDKEDKYGLLWLIEGTVRDYWGRGAQRQTETSWNSRKQLLLPTSYYAASTVEIF